MQPTDTRWSQNVDKLKELSDDDLEQVHASAGTYDVWLYQKAGEEIERRSKLSPLARKCERERPSKFELEYPW